MQVERLKQTDEMDFFHKIEIKDHPIFIICGNDKKGRSIHFIETNFGVYTKIMLDHNGKITVEEGLSAPALDEFAEEIRINQFTLSKGQKEFMDIAYYKPKGHNLLVWHKKRFKDFELNTGPLYFLRDELQFYTPLDSKQLEEESKRLYSWGWINHNVRTQILEYAETYIGNYSSYNIVTKDMLDKAFPRGKLIEDVEARNRNRSIGIESKSRLDTL